MLRRGRDRRAGLFALSLVALAMTTMSPREVRADDDVISLEGLPPELLQALTAGSTMSPDVLAALLAASGGSHAAAGGAAATTATAGGRAAGASTGSASAAGIDGGPAGVAALSGLLDGMNLDTPAAGDGAHAAGSGGATAASGGGGGIVDVRHPGDPPATATVRRGPERIRSGRSGGIVELHPAVDDASSADGAVVVGESATGGAGTTLPPVRIARPHGRRGRPVRSRGH